MVAVVGRTGTPLMPVTEYKARKLQQKGRAVIYRYRPHDIVWIDGVRYTVKGVISNGTRVALNERLPVSVHKIQKIIHIGGWYMA